MMLLKMAFVLNGENQGNLGLNTLLLFCFSFFFLLLIGLKAILVTMASREEVTIYEDEVR